MLHNNTVNIRVTPTLGQVRVTTVAVNKAVSTTYS